MDVDEALAAWLRGIHPGQTAAVVAWRGLRVLISLAEAARAPQEKAMLDI